jgi:hypothetical protein
VKARLAVLPRFVSAALLGLLMLAVVSKPMASTLCETHRLGHTLATLSHANFREDSTAERMLDADHASGAHSLLHGGDQGATYADIAAVVTLPRVHFESIATPLPAVLPVPTQPVARPFRPPIV